MPFVLLPGVYDQRHVHVVFCRKLPELFDGDVLPRVKFEFHHHNHEVEGLLARPQKRGMSTKNAGISGLGSVVYPISYYTTYYKYKHVLNLREFNDCGTINCRDICSTRHSDAIYQMYSLFDVVTKRPWSVPTYFRFFRGAILTGSLRKDSNRRAETRPFRRIPNSPTTPKTKQTARKPNSQDVFRDVEGR